MFWKIVIFVLGLVSYNVDAGCTEIKDFNPNNGNKQVKILCVDVNTAEIKQSLDSTSRTFSANIRELFEVRDSYLTSVNSTTLNFIHASYIDEVKISHCSLQSIEPRAFSSFARYLKRLFLDRNHLTNITAYAFLEIVNLQYLHLNSSDIEFIHPAAFKDLKNLVYLNLDNNKLKTINLQELPKLQTLILSRNYFKKFDPSIFSNNLFLNSLDISYNYFKIVDESIFSKLINLTDLDFSYNYITDFNFTALTNKSLIKIIDIKGNNWSCKAIRNFREIEILGHSDAQNNDIKCMMEDLKISVGGIDAIIKNCSFQGIATNDTQFILQKINTNFNEIKNFTVTNVSEYRALVEINLIEVKNMTNSILEILLNIFQQMELIKNNLKNVTLDKTDSDLNTTLAYLMKTELITNAIDKLKNITESQVNLQELNKIKNSTDTGLNEIKIMTNTNYQEIQDLKSSLNDINKLNEPISIFHSANELVNQQKPTPYNPSSSVEVFICVLVVINLTMTLIAIVVFFKFTKTNRQLLLFNQSELNSI